MKVYVQTENGVGKYEVAHANNESCDLTSENDTFIGYRGKMYSNPACTIEISLSDLIIEEQQHTIAACEDKIKILETQNEELLGALLEISEIIYA